MNEWEGVYGAVRVIGPVTLFYIAVPSSVVAYALHRVENSDLERQPLLYGWILDGMVRNVQERLGYKEV